MYKAKNIDTDKVLEAINEARRLQDAKISREIGEKKAYLEGVNKGLDIAEGFFECCNYEKNMKQEVENVRM